MQLEENPSLVLYFCLPTLSLAQWEVRRGVNYTGCYYIQVTFSEPFVCSIY